jgi:fatty-acyl-CoA synthase
MAEEVAVEVGEDRVHGSTAVIRVKGTAGVTKEAVEERVKEILARYTVHYRVEMSS